MYKSMFSLISIVLITIHAHPASGVIIDGSITGDGYGTPIAVQTVNTEFGDDLNNTDIFSSLKGSELDAAYARIDGSTLNLAFTGNLEDSFNKLVLFFDTIPGGQNVLDTDTDNGGVNPLTDPSPFPSDPSMFAKLAGSSFDSGFGADYVMVLRHGFTGSENRFDVDFAVLGGATNQYLGVFNPVYTSDWNGSGSTGTGAANSAPIAVGLDNSNILGVVAGSSAANATDAAAVTTGIEVGLPLENIGNPTNDIKITAFITNSNHDFVSNQFLGGLPAAFGNIGNGQPEALFSLGNYAGEQFFVVEKPVLAADFDKDGDVDNDDLTDPVVGWEARFGVDLDGLNFLDWQREYGIDLSSVVATIALPEPSTATLALATTLCLTFRRRRFVRSE